MSNMKSWINSHNYRILRQTTNNTPEENNCNCRKKDECPMSGKCTNKNVIYQAEVTTSDNQIKRYVGMTSNAFKDRFRNHQKSFREKKHKNETELSKYIWELKKNRKDFQINRSILKRAASYRNGARRCNLCLEEKLQIMKADKRTLLNKKRELFSKCRHQISWSIGNLNRKKRYP